MHGLRLPGKDVVDKSGEKREWTGADNEIWSYGEETEAIFTKYIRIRERMRPYTARLMHEAHRNGTPVIRTLFYEFPSDEAAWDVGDEYLYGDSLLVAPVCQAHATGRSVYLPAGAVWTSVISGEPFAGGQRIETSASLGQIPVFLRDGREAWLLGLI